MPAWKKVKLGDVCEIKHGYAFKGKFFSEIPNRNILLTPGNIKIGGGFKKDKFKYYTGDIPLDYVLKEGDVIVTMTDLSKDGDTLGYSALVPKSSNLNYLHNQRLGLVKLQSNEVDLNFLYWLLRTKEYQNFIVGSATGTTVKHTSPSRILEYEAEFPDLHTQTRIASILSALDDKIELNRQMNHTLEQMAQALFKKYFVDDIDVENLPDGWRLGKLDDELEIVMGQSPSGSSYNEIQNGIPFFQGRTDFEFRYPTLRIYTTEPKRFAKKFDTLLSVRAPVGDINIARVDCCVGRGLAALRNRNGFQSYCYYKLKSLEDSFEKFNGEGTVFGSINKDSLSSLSVIIPDIKIVERFEEIANPWDSLIHCLTDETTHLLSIRDSLLPKLMSGEIEIKEAETNLA